MIAIVRAAREWLISVVGGWNRFWFTPSDHETLALIRILGGCMLFYTHFVWGLNLTAFLGPDGWLPNDLAREMMRGSYAWNYLWYFESPAALWTLHIFALIVFAMLTAGLYTRVVSVLAGVITLAYCHRLTGAFFGLDQVNAMLAIYLMVGPCGNAYSMDRWLQKRRGSVEPPPPSITANISIRLIQLHMCVIYLFGGISKMRGEMWWDGTAVWGAVANLEYQSYADLTWLVYYPWLVSLLTHITVFWETFYCVLVWPKMTRWITLLLAVCVHGGIALFLGMITFGVAMIFGNMAFVPPQTVRACVAWFGGLFTRAGEGTSIESAANGARRIALPQRKHRRRPRQA